MAIPSGRDCEAVVRTGGQQHVLGGHEDSFRIPQGFQVDNPNGRIKLPKIGWMRYRKSREIAGTPKNVTVSLVHGKAFISIQTEREVATPMHPSKSSVGLDWGIKRFYTLSNGEYEEPLSPLQQFAVKVAKLQRVLARKKKFSKNWKKAKFKVAKLHNQIANIRKDFVHKSSKDLSKNHAVVFIEDLSIRNMSKSARGSHYKGVEDVKKEETKPSLPLLMKVCAKSRAHRNSARH